VGSAVVTAAEEATMIAVVDTTTDVVGMMTGDEVADMTTDVVDMMTVGMTIDVEVTETETMEGETTVTDEMTVATTTEGRDCNVRKQRNAEDCFQGRCWYSC
jgi:hypothetical protein